MLLHSARYKAAIAAVNDALQALADLLEEDMEKTAIRLSRRNPGAEVSVVCATGWGHWVEVDKPGKEPRRLEASPILKALDQVDDMYGHGCGGGLGTPLNTCIKAKDGVVTFRRDKDTP